MSWVWAIFGVAAIAVLAINLAVMLWITVQLPFDLYREWRLERQRREARS